MVSGHLQVKKGYYYAVLSYYDSKNKRHVKYISTGLPEKGNKRKAETELVKIRNAFEPPAEIGELCSSMRTLPLVGRFKEYFAEVKAAQELNKQICGNCYNYEYDGFVFVDELGERIKPDYLTSQFPAFIQRHGMKKMRFHDLRHSCASLLMANGVPLKQIQDWLGHSDFSTTANIYAHLDYSSKLSSAQAMVSGMPLPEAGDFGSRWEQNAEKSGV